MTPLSQRHCTPREGSAPLDAAACAALLAQLTGWRVEGKRLTRTFKFANHYETQAFVNALMWVSHREDHHPDLHVGYDTVHVSYWTHVVDGLSENDFICAARLDALSA